MHHPRSFLGRPHLKLKSKSIHDSPIIAHPVVGRSATLTRDYFRFARYPTATSRTRTLLSVNPWRLGTSYRARFAGRIEHQVVEPLSKPSTNQRSRLMLDWDAGPLFQAA